MRDYNKNPIQMYNFLAEVLKTAAKHNKTTSRETPVYTESEQQSKRLDKDERPDEENRSNGR